MYHYTAAYSYPVTKLSFYRKTKYFIKKISIPNLLKFYINFIHKIIKCLHTGFHICTYMLRYLKKKF